MSFRVEINERVFAKTIDSVKHCITTKDFNRPALGFIKLTISKGKLTAYACDGFRAARTTIALPNINEFECYIKPIKIKPSKSGVNPVVIELENNIATVEVITEYGKIKYCFEQFNYKFVDIDKMCQNAHLYDRKTGANPNYVKQALTALSQITPKINPSVIFETREERFEPIVIWAKDGDCISEQLILPMRINEERQKRSESNL